MLRNTTPNHSLKPHIDSCKRARFFYAFDHKDDAGRVPARRLFEDFGLKKSTAYNLLNERQEFGRIYYTGDKRFLPIDGFWDGVQFTDEAHMALDDFPEEWILRVIGERYKPENLVEHTKKSANVVHFAAWINYYTKAEELTFYNDEYDDVELVKLPPKLRARPKTETPEDY
ncbi:hypothetical protein FB567DRAFT_592207 [Paraphoma chrysanthemicola]|uniref:Uncharacterized protein n=1 Tax=Paraphoma chrysanthemicola TaxID=798071 RepID=A0A8K0R7T2_9PLEO|nr:hypothetical protein FB567DRAFT_592207 [Paraphoma chrysanthemicola]